MRILRAALAAGLMLGSLSPFGWAQEAPDATPGKTPETVTPEIVAPEVVAPEDMPPEKVVPEKATETETAYHHPYGGKVFTSLVEDSCQTTHRSSVDYFYTWMDGHTLGVARAFPAGKQGRDWPDVLDRHRVALEAIKDPEQRARKELALGTWLHATVKRAIPNYSLDRGFEFANTAQFEERQCLMQSMLISSLLQAMGVDAGIAMMNQNRDGEYTNNTHVVVMLKMANGHDALVDGSYRETLVAHKGLMAIVPGKGYRYVRPVYSDDYREIIGYREEPSRRMISTEAVRPMDVPFMRSQIDFYRGERTPGGVLAKRNSRAGLERSVRFFEASLKNCPRNPLSAYMLARTYEEQGLLVDANRQFRLARDIYSQAGWVPNELYRAISRTGGESASVARRRGRARAGSAR